MQATANPVSSLSRCFSEKLVKVLANTSQNTELADPNFIIGLSGGLDSVVLLDLFAMAVKQNLIEPSSLKAIYVDHQLQNESANWGQFCQTLCNNYHIEFESITVVVCDASRQGLEQKARLARYQALFTNLKSPNDFLVTAHHANDQCETVLLNLFRGTGIRGLGAMPKLNFSSKGQHFRPLLDVERMTLQEYARQKGLVWIEDPSNQDQRLRRNWVRRRLIPTIKQQFPAVEKNLQQVAQHAQEADVLLETLAKIQLSTLQGKPRQVCAKGPLILPSQLNRHSEQGQLSWVEFKNILRFWQKENAFPRLRQADFDWLAQCAYGEQTQTSDQWELKSIVTGKRMLKTGSYWQLYDRKLYFVPQRESRCLSVTKFLQALQTVPVTENALSNPEQVELCLWLSLSKKQPNIPLDQLFMVSISQLPQLNLQHSMDFKLLKKRLQELKVPPWIKQNWPMVVLQQAGELQLVGYFGCKNFFNFFQGVNTSSLQDFSSIRVHPEQKNTFVLADFISVFQNTQLYCEFK